MFAQALVGVSLTGIRFSHQKRAQGSIALITLDDVIVEDLLRPSDSSFCIMATSLSPFESPREKAFSFSTQVKLEPMSWESYGVVAIKFGFKIPEAMRTRGHVISQHLSASAPETFLTNRF